MVDQFVNNEGDVVNFTGPDSPPPAANDRDMYRTLDVITELGWECHRAWEKIIGEEYGCPWDELQNSHKDELRESVAWLINHPTSSVSTQHDAWRSRMVTIDPDHENLIPYDELPWPQQMKARLWRHVILAVVG
jgi:hypothetical protein